MAAVERDEVVGCSNPKLDLFTKVTGTAVDVAVLEWKITDSGGNDVEPAGPGRTIVDPTVLCPTGPKIGTGHYAASWTVPTLQPFGTYTITWFFKLTTTSPEVSFAEEFEVQAVVAGSGFDGYATVQDFRDEGFTDPPVSDARLQALITMMSQRIDSLTGQWFEPRSGTMTIDGRDSRALRFPVPICNITEVRIDTTVVDASSYRVYNRHLSGTLFPDDRSDPRIVFFEAAQNLPITLWSSAAFPAGFQNIEVDGVFGYTDGPGIPGTTPLLIKLALMLMVRKQIPLISNSEDRTAELIVGKIMREETRDQRAELNPKLMEKDGTFGYQLTGDSEIDSILIQFMAPISIGDTGGDPRDLGGVWTSAHRF